MPRLPILMYHNVSIDESKGLTISQKKLESQLSYLSKEGYKTYHFKDLHQIPNDSSEKNILITFDDGYINQVEFALPILKKFALKATFFIPLNFLGKKDSWNTSELEIMTVEQLKALDPEIIELGFHSFYHKKYTELSNAEIESDTSKCIEFAGKNNLEFSAVLAYPYGKYPKGKIHSKSFQKILSQNGIEYGLRIGNRLNSFPFKKPYEIERIDVKGEWSLMKFRRKIRFGKFF